MTFEEANKLLKSYDKEAINAFNIKTYNGICDLCDHRKDGCLFRQRNVESCNFFMVINK